MHMRTVVFERPVKNGCIVFVRKHRSIEDGSCGKERNGASAPCDFEAVVLYQGLSKGLGHSHGKCHESV